MDPVSTEQQMYEQMRARPLNADVTYLAVPWAPIINQGELDDLALPQLNGGFTVCQHVSYREIIPLLTEAGIETLFTPHASDAGNIGDIRVKAIPHVSINGDEPTVEKDLLYSFIGFDSTTPIGNPLRSKLLTMSHPGQTVIRQRAYWHWADEPGEHSNQVNRQLEEAAEYRNVLARSRFSICPRGYGPGTVRFWESLQAGAIPLLLSDDWLLPDGFDWDQCVIRIPEDRAHDIPDVIRSIGPEEESAMRAACGRAFALNTGANLTRMIRLDQTFRIYTLVTPSHRQIFERWFLPTLSERCEVRVQMDRQHCPSGDFQTEGWLLTMMSKVDCILRAIEENWGGSFLFADADVQFFGPVANMVSAGLSGNDMVFQRDSPQGALCAGFFGARANIRTKQLWNDIRTRIGVALQSGAEEMDLSDQTELNKILRSVHGSEQNWNKFGIRWGLFSSDAVFSPGALTGREWEHGDAIEPPAEIKAHHANWTIGVANKVSLLQAVRNHVAGTGAPPATMRDDIEVIRFGVADREIETAMIARK